MKLAAFTLIEVVVALAVLSIVTALTYNGFTYLSQGTRGYVENTAAHLELMGFVSRMENDIALAHSINYGESDNIILQYYNDNNIEYSLGANHLVRRSNDTRDSIAVKSVKVAQLSQAENITAQPLVSSIAIDALLFEQTVPLYFFKEYTATQYLPRL